MKKFKIKFIEKEKLWLFISLITILFGLYIAVSNSFQSKQPLNYGIDFIGGNTFLLKLNETNTDLQNSQEALINNIRTVLTSFQLQNSQIQLSQNNEVFIKTLKVNKDITSEIIKSLKESIGEFEILEIEFIGPSIGKKLKDQTIWIILTVSILLLAYISFRFELAFGIAALIAVLHDGLIILSIAAITGIEINTTFIAALLTVLGYSINDTIVIFDRIRENIENLNEYVSLKNLTNNSLNQTLLRTINTSMTTIIVIMSLILFGGTTIKEFCIVLLIGIISGTYSSLCVASPIIVRLYPKKEFIKE